MRHVLLLALAAVSIDSVGCSSSQVNATSAATQPSASRQRALEPFLLPIDDLVEAIASSNPAIVGLRDEAANMGHAVVVYAATYEPVEPSVGRSIFGNVVDSVVKHEAGSRGIRSDQVDAVGVTKGPAKYRLAEVEYVDPMDGRRYKLNAQGFKNRVDFIVTKERAL